MPLHNVSCILLKNDIQYLFNLLNALLINILSIHCCSNDKIRNWKKIKNLITKCDGKLVVFHTRNDAEIVFPYVCCQYSML